MYIWAFHLFHLNFPSKWIKTNSIRKCLSKCSHLLNINIRAYMQYSRMGTVQQFSFIEMSVKSSLRTSAVCITSVSCHLSQYTLFPDLYWHPWSSVLLSLIRRVLVWMMHILFWYKGYHFFLSFVHCWKHCACLLQAMVLSNTCILYIHMCVICFIYIQHTYQHINSLHNLVV